MSEGRRAPLAIVAAMAILAPLPLAGLGPEGGARLSRGDLVLPVPEGGAARFRFLPDGAWARYDRELRLSAAPGEERPYRLEIATAEGGSSVFDYVVDKRPPRPPVAEPAGGLFDAPLHLFIRCEEGSRAYWALFGPLDREPAFAPFDSASPPLLELPRDGTASYTLVAYAEDGAGNRSAPRRFAYRLASPGLPASAPAQDPPEADLLPDAGMAAPILERKPGSIDLAFPLAAGARLLVAVGGDEAPALPSGYAELEPRDGVAHLVLSCPYGWSGKLRLFYGISSGGSAYRAPSPLELELAYPAGPILPPPEPLPPSIVSDGAGRGSFLAFPDYDGSILASVDGGAPKPYLGPLGLPSGAEEVAVSWFGEDGSGLRSATRSARLALPRPAPEAALAGVSEGAVVGTSLRLAPASPATIRYELSESSGRSPGALPPEPTGDSPLVGKGLSFDCPPGEERSFVLRYRAFAGEEPAAAAGEGRLLRFSIDRAPPSPPALALQPPAYSDRTVRLEFAPGEGGSSLLASVEVDGASAPFLPAAAGLELPGSDAGPVSYLVRAYRVDAAGNRSAEMKGVALVVDRSSVYAADDAADAGDGSPTRPYRSLDEAMAAAFAGGKRSLCLRGSFEAKRPVLVADAPFAIVGGFGPGWAKDANARARLRVSAPGGSPAFSAKGSSLSLRGLEISFESPGAAALVDLRGAGLEIDDCLLSAGGPGDILFVSASSSRVAISRSTIAALKAMSCAVVRAEASEVTARDSSFSARPGVRAFSAFDLAGGSLEASGSLVESSADLALRMLSLKGSRLVMDRCLLRAEAGSGYLRIGSFSGVQGEVRNSRVLVSWKGEGLLFESSGFGPAFRHDTISAETGRGKLGFFAATGRPPEIWNCILSCAEGGGAMLRSERKPGAGILVADCFWGFERLVEGGWLASTIAELDSLNEGNAALSALGHLSEPPSRTFSAPAKSLATLSRGSACVDAAYPLDGAGYSLDFGGAPRPAALGGATGPARPDIGADEAGE